MKAFFSLPTSMLPVALLAMVAFCSASGAFAADLEQESRAATGFSRIDISGKFDVTLVQGDTEGVTVEAPAAVMKQIRTEVKGRTLVVDVTQNRSSIWDWLSAHSSSGHSPRVTIRFRELERIEAAGADTINADSLKTSDLRLDLAGACTIKIRDLQATSLVIDGSGAIKASIGGKVGRQRVDLSGAGSYLAEGLASDEAKVEVSGAGKAIVNAKNTLDVEISGAGKVEYLGDPKIKRSISGIGSISRRDAP